MKLCKIISVTLALLTLSSCSGNGGGNGRNNASTKDMSKVGLLTEGEGTSGILTNIFRMEELPLPDGYDLREGVRPIIDKESGEMTFVCTSYANEADENGDFRQIRHVLTLTENGTVVNDKVLLEDIDAISYMSDAEFYGNYLIYSAQTYDYDMGIRRDYIVKYDLTTDTFVRLDDLKPLFEDNGRSSVGVEMLSVDSDGYIYICTSEEIAVLDENMVLSFSLFSEYGFISMNTAPNGTVYVTELMGSDGLLIPIDKKIRNLGEPLDIGTFFLSAKFGDDGKVYFTTGDGWFVFDPASEEPAEKLMDYKNSNINSVTVICPLDRETFIGSEYDSVTDSDTTGIFRKAEDVNLDNVKVIDVAVAYSLDRFDEALVVEFNKNHPDVRIVINDYSIYNSIYDYEPGGRMLATDMIAGNYKPDIIVAYANGSADLFDYLMTNDLCTDLYTLIDNDTDSSRDDLFGAVTKTYENNGELWCLPKSFFVNTVIAPKSIIGKRESWTFNELLDFAETLPDGVELTSYLTKSNASKLLFSGQGYGTFIDGQTNTAHFDSPEFIRYLEFISELPDEIQPYSDPDKPSYLRFHNGEFALKTTSIDDFAGWSKLPAEFNTDEYTIIGYPTAQEGENGSYILNNSVFIVTSYCEYPVTAWDFLEKIFKNEDYMSEFPIFKSIYDSKATEYGHKETLWYFDGHVYTRNYRENDPLTEEDLTAPGIVLEFGEKDAAELKEFLDAKVGIPKITGISDEVIAIVDEEISSFTSGVRSAEATADIIQSRVSIWLAEHE